ncbi:hypothetical protein IFM89_036161 [Coptis chinensis]|uniref:F-box domain-containing protein n=1 Tax=Coptis chinensis TaxID=261450 RepID=A0A835H078_9MAGN|nr:hypothetical protein IFM89_036161 [Coptis chinensis]
MEMDRISNLPEPIRSHILDFLPMGDAFRTSILSRQWRYVCFSLSNLTFDQHSFMQKKNYGDFADSLNFDQFSFMQKKNSREYADDFVNRILSHHDGSAIINFEVNNNDYIYPVSVPDVNAWISYAVDHNVQKLRIHGVPTKYDAALSGDLFTCISLTSLTLERLGLYLPRTVGFPLLKTLKLDDVYIPSENSINKLFSNCPVLENLAIRRCSFLICNCREPLNIFVPSLKRLSLLFVHYHKKTNISSPNLKQFACLGHPPDISLETRLSLRTASFTWSVTRSDQRTSYIHSAHKIVAGLHNVTELCLYDFCIEALTSRDPVCLPTYSTLKHLHLHMLPIENQVQAVIVLLKRTPNLQTLGIYVMMRKTMQDTLVEKEYWQPQELYSVHTLNHLKLLKIESLQGTKSEFRLLRHLFENGNAIERMNICYSKEVTEAGRTGFSEKIMKLARVLTEVEISAGDDSYKPHPHAFKWLTF